MWYQRLIDLSITKWTELSIGWTMKGMAPKPMAVVVHFIIGVGRRVVALEDICSIIEICPLMSRVHKNQFHSATDVQVIGNETKTLPPSLH